MTNVNALNAAERELVSAVQQHTRRLPAQLEGYTASDWASKMIVDDTRIGWDADSNAGADQYWSAAAEIQEAAAMCKAESHHEESWCDNVFLPVLNLAKARSGLRRRVMVANM